MNLRNLFEFFGSLPLSRKRGSDPSLARFQKSLFYRFRDTSLLRQALTHKSCVSVDDREGIKSNERMEFLGDAVLNCLITEHLYRLYPDKSEGQLSKVKSLIVSRKILGEIALTIDLGQYLFFGNSEMKSGGVQRVSIISNAFEAVLGAIFLDGGLEASRAFLKRFVFCRIESFLSDSDNINYKSKILELSQHDGFGFPHYTVIETSGPDHAKEYRVRVKITGVTLGEGRGPNKKIAQQNAAREAIEKYSKDYIISHKGEKSDELVSHGRTADDC
jgi:ribonuclease III